MKLKLALSLMCGCALTLSAQQGYKDGIEYYRADKLWEAQEILDNTLNDAGTDKAEAYYYLGQVALAQDKLADAEQNFQKGIAADAANPFNYVGMGALELKKGDAKAAETFFKEAKSRSKKNAVMLTDIARAYYNANPAGYAKEIEKTLAEAKKADKTSPAIYILEADMKAKEDVGDAAGFYEMAWTYDKKNEYPEAYTKYAQVYFPVNPKFAIDRLKELLTKQPNSALAQRELAEKYYDNNQFTMAAQQYSEYIKNPNHFQRDEQRYVGLLNFAKEYQQSFDLASSIVAKDPGNFYMQRMQFLNKAALENYPDALKYAKTFFANPKAQGNFVANDYSTYGEVLIHTGDTIGAIEAYTTALSIQPDNLERIKDLSSVYSDAKQYGKSAEVFQEYIDKAENVSTNDKFTLARRYNNASTTATDSIQKINYADKALVYLDEVLAVVPDNFSVANQKAITMFTRNNNQMTQEITDAFLNALAILDKDPANKVSHKNDYVRAYNLIANYYLGEGDKDTAKEYLVKFLEVDPDNEPLRQYVDNMK